MIDIQNINGYGIEDPGFALLREVAQKYCPEELQAVRPSRATTALASASLRRRSCATCTTRRPTR